MDDDFMKRFDDYMEGKLQGREKEEVEKEIEKLECYQWLLDKHIGDGRPEWAQSTSDEKKIIRRGKWKARLLTAVAAIGITLGFVIVSGIFTSLFYTLGEPSRIDEYRDAVVSTVAVTQPNVTLRSTGTSVNQLFGMNMKGELRKMVGRSYIRAGSMDISFLLGQAGYPDREWFLDGDTIYAFSYPGSGKGDTLESDWTAMDKLPEGTVCEAYISLDRFYSTDEILKTLPDTIEPVWFAVDTGFDNPETVHDAPETIGFPYMPLWHADDWTVTEHSEENRGLAGKVVMESKKAPELEARGSGDIRDENFLKTLQLLEKYEDIADRVAYGQKLDIKKRLEYVKNNGINIYGIVVTGPTKEILKLKGQAWVAEAKLGEVRLWNWK